MIQTIAYGLTIGGILYITSIGLSITFGTMKIVNFAHGIVYTFGAYALIASLSVVNNYFLAVIIGLLIMIPISYIIEKFIIRKLYGKSVEMAIVATYALILIGVDVVKWIWGASPIPLNDPVGISINIGIAELPLFRIIIILLSFGIFLGTKYFFKKTIVGKIIIAGLDDTETVQSLGININKYFLYVFVLGSMLAALGGMLYAPITSIHPYMGFNILQLCFAVVLVGGLGNLDGTFYSAFFLGLVMAITGKFWGPASDAMVFLVMALVLVFRPISKHSIEEN